MIRHVDVEFEGGYTVITGETGAGKSIILGALGLILGNRLDSANFKNQKEKCVIEGHFTLNTNTLKPFFDKYDFDFEKETILRREINLSGKSRMFLNDTPISLEQLKEFKTFIIHIHSQHETQTMVESKFQFEFIDAIALNQSTLKTFREELKELKQKTATLNDLIEKQENFEKEKSFIEFQLREIEELNLQIGEENSLLDELSRLANAESLTEKLNHANNLIIQEEYGLLDRLQELCQVVTALYQINSNLEPLNNKAEAVLEELQDIQRELEHYSDKVELNPDRLAQVESRLGIIHALNLKHKINDADGLLRVQNELKAYNLDFEDNQEKVYTLEKQISQLKSHLNDLANELHLKRLSCKEQVCSNVKNNLKYLGMPDVEFDVQFSKLENFNAYGLTNMELKFNANKGGSLQSIAKVASGGELSRLMLAIRSLMAKHTIMPTMIFDEIDSGISGEIANKMASQLEQMSKNMQLIAITHSPQLASKGQRHFHVVKHKVDDETTTSIKQLTDDERVVEIAKMLSGATLSNSAISNAKDLIKNN